MSAQPGPYRLAAPAGAWIERSQPLGFTFNDVPLTGLAGDTLASALLANGVRLVGRSFKLHRPRGIWSCGAEEPSALVDVGEGAPAHAQCARDAAAAGRGAARAQRQLLAERGV